MDTNRPATIVINRSGVRWWLGRGVDPERAVPLLAAAIEAVEAGSPNLKGGRRKELYRLALAGDEPDHLLKVTRYQHGSPLTRRVRKSKARRELEIAARLNDSGIDTPLPIAAGEDRRAGLLTACYLLVPFEADVVDLAAFARSTPIPRARRDTAAKFGALTQRLHSIGFRQADFAPNNFLLRPNDAFGIEPIDFERANLPHRGQPLDRPTRLQSLAKLERHCMDVSATDRFRFLFRYANDRENARLYWRDTERAISELFARDHSRLRRISTSGARRYQRYRAGAWEGWALRETNALDKVEEWLARDAEVGRIEAVSKLWVCSYRDRIDPRAEDLWATARALWTRGQLAPEPICAVKRGPEVRLFLDRNIPTPAQEPSRKPSQNPSQTPAELSLESKSRPLVRLIDRLLGLGELSPKISAESVAWVRKADGTSRAMLVDVAMLRPGSLTSTDRRRRAREISDRLLAESATAPRAPG